MSGSSLPPVETLLPQRGAMMLLDRLLEHDESGTTARVVVADQRWLRRADGSLPAWLAVEYMAQCAAAHEALRMGAEGRVGRGFLVAVRELRFAAPRFEVDSVLRVHVRRAGGRPGLGVLSYAGSVHAEERPSSPLAEGRIAIALDRSRIPVASRDPE